MSYSKSIWHNVTACNYKSNKSYGNQNQSNETIYVGSSASNSHEHCKIKTSKEFKNGLVVFRTMVDGVVLVETTFKDNNGRAGGFIKKISKLNRIKSLK